MPDWLFWLGLTIAVLIYVWVWFGDRIKARVPKAKYYFGFGEKKIVTARKIDPDRPPTWKIYSPKKKNVDAPFCMCHRRSLVPGQRVLFWPIPNSPAIDLFCEDGIEAAGESDYT